MTGVSGVSSQACAPQFPAWQTAAGDEKSLAARVSDLGSRIITTGGPALAATSSIAAASALEFAIYFLGVVTISGIVGYIAARIFLSCCDTDINTRKEEIQAIKRNFDKDRADKERDRLNREIDRLKLKKEWLKIEKESADSQRNLLKLAKEFEDIQKELEAILSKSNRFPYGTSGDDDDDTDGLLISSTLAGLHKQQNQKDEIANLRKRLKFLEAEYDRRMEKRLGKLDDEVIADTDK